MSFTLHHFRVGLDGKEPHQPRWEQANLACFTHPAQAKMFRFFGQRRLTEQYTVAEKHQCVLRSRAVQPSPYPAGRNV